MVAKLIHSTYQLAFFTLLCVVLTGADELFIVRRTLTNKTTELQCFYNGPQEYSLALSWILPQGVPMIYESHQRWKHKTNDGFVRGHFEYYGHVWEAKHALDVQNSILPPVLDERWNDMQRVDTTPLGQFKLLSKFTTDRFHLSVLAKSDAQIALHTGDSAHTSMSYLLTLEPSDNAGVITLALCPGGIRTENGTHGCFLLFKSEVIGSSNLLKNAKEWTHFTINFEYSPLLHHITLSDATKSGKKLLDFRKSQAYHRKPSGISVRTVNSYGSWRLHNHRVVIHNGKEDGEGFNVMVLNKPSMSCLQIHYFFRKGYGKAYVKTKDGSFSMELEPTDGKWKYTVIKAMMKAPSDYLHFVVPFGDHLTHVSPVFALHQPFRVCGEDEFFTSKVFLPNGTNPTNTICQIVGEEKFAVVRSSVYTGPSEIECPPNVFGKYCNITCGNVMGDATCRAKVLCDTDRCSCLPGYEPTSNWDTACLEAKPNAPINVTATPLEVEEVEEEDSSENKETSDAYMEWDYNAQEIPEKTNNSVVWWIVALLCSWVVAVFSLYLVFKERPDLVPICIYNPIMRCTGQNRGGDQLIEDDNA
ncbi:uncharacterized protein LOC132194181 [Neocloeon triangulifer]|uniref:uncharacterized protein LOC132194181 n=1 Tax=Neocloeon triangulifer TaxID=2078957 RepID=UPI00286EB783|nr:uncharacterized protein LOC132194181 [Neocloeon triangulifer]